MLGCMFLERLEQWKKLTNISSPRSTDNPNAFSGNLRNDKPAFEYPEKIKFSMKNQTNV